jgi:hypothetical protein
VARRATSTEAQLLERVLRKLDLARSVDPDLVSDRTAQGRALLAVLAFAREAGEGVSLGQVTAHFEGSEHWAVVEEALRETILDQFGDSDIDLAPELDGLSARLREQRTTGRQRELAARWEAGSLTDAERAEWAALQALQAASKGVNSDPDSQPKV